MTGSTRFAFVCVLSALAAGCPPAPDPDGGPPPAGELTITSDPVTEATEDSPYAYALDAESPDEPVDFTATTLPAWLALNGANLEGTPLNEHVGDHPVVVEAEDAAGEIATQSFTITVANTNDAPTISGTPGTSVEVGFPYSFVPAAADVDVGDTLTFTADNAPSWASFDAATGALTGTPLEADIGTTTGVVITVTDAAGAAASLPAFDLEVTSASPLPPDPADIAPDRPRDRAQTTYDANRFLFESDPPVQRDVEANAVVPERAALVRGRVLGAGGAALERVRVSVLGAPELGHTLSRADGFYDLLINGGGAPTLTFERPGFLTAQRALKIGWSESISFEDVTLIQRAEVAGVIDLDDTSTPLQVARSAAVSDDRGVRTTALAIRAGTSAEAELADGTRVPLDTLTLRATEYTVGSYDEGLARMPGELPRGIAYTYATELSVDEAEVSGAKTVHFDIPAVQYVDDFLGFPAGSPVPVFTYDFDLGAWLQLDDGRVIEILSTDGGSADLDIDGSGSAASAADLLALGIDADERALLATDYAAGDVLWRAELPHLTPVDLNWPPIFPEDAEDPPVFDPFEFLDPPDMDCEASGGSSILCERQVLLERFDLRGADADLVYSSERVPGYRASAELNLPLTGAEIPSSLEDVRLVVDIAGQHSVQIFQPQANLVERVTWDGLDAYGRPVQGREVMRLRVGYTYLVDYACGLAVCPRAPQTRWSEAEIEVGGWDARGVGLGGLTLTSHHVLDTSAGVVRKGDGTQLAGRGSSAVVYDLIEGTPNLGNLMSFVRTDVVAGPDGALWIPDHIRDQLWRFQDGVLELANDPSDGTPEDGPLSGMELDEPWEVAFGPRGDFYIFELRGDQRTIHVDQNLFARTFMTNHRDLPNGEYWYERTEERWRAEEHWGNGVESAAVGRDGTLYIADGSVAILAVSPDGWVRRVAGQTEFCGGPCGDDGPALEAGFSYIYGMEIDDQGGIWVADSDNGLRYISPDGIIRKVAPGRQVGDVALAPDGSVYFTQRNAYLVRRVTPEGDVHTVAGDGSRGLPIEPFAGQPATTVGIDGPEGLALHPDGSLYIRHGNNDPRITRVVSPLPGFSVSDVLIPDRAAGELYVFDGGTGRHRQTLHLKTGALLRAFTYDGEGRLVSALDPLDVGVTVTRPDASTVVLTTETGRATTLALDAEGFASTVTTPGGDVTALEVSADGRLTGVTWPSGRSSAASYDDTGRLTSDTSPTGRVQGFTRETDAATRTTTVTRDDARTGTHVYETVIPTAGESTRTIDSSCCGTHARTLLLDGSVEIARPNGTTIVIERGPDPAHGMLDPVATRVDVSYPDGTSRTFTMTREQNLETLVEGAATWTRAYEPGTGVETRTSPEGRASTTTYASGRVVREQRGARAPVVRAYDAAGRLSQLRLGDDVAAPDWAFTYDGLGRLATFTAPTDDTYTVELDDEDRTTGLVLPDARRYGLVRDAGGLITGHVADDGTTWTLQRDALGRVSALVPPTVSGDDTLSYTRDAAGRVTALDWTDGVSVGLVYDAGGRPTTVTQPGESIALTYTSAGQLETATSTTGPDLSLTWQGARLTQQAWTTGSTETVFDGAGRVTSETVNGGDAVARAYDLDGALISAGPVTLARGASHAEVETITVGGLVETREHDVHGRLSRQVLAFNATPIMTLEYVRDDAGRVVEEIETQGAPVTRAFAYDAAGRLSSTTAAGFTTTLGYDARDNRTSTDDGVVTVTATFDAQDRPLTLGAASYTHDTRGDRLTRTDTATTSYVHDALGRLAQVTLPGGSVVDYAVDPLGRRVEKRVDAAHVAGWVYGREGSIVAELDAAGAVRSRFIYASAEDVPDAVLLGGETFRVFTDQRGSVRLVVNAATGGVAQSLRYDAFGNILEDTAIGLQPFGFAGGHYDPDTALVRFGARDYDPELGRWVTRDPSLFTSIAPNLYAYAQGDPVNHRDPSGRVVPGVIAVVIVNAPAIAAAAATVIAVANQAGLLPLDHGMPPIDPSGQVAALVGEIIRQAIHHDQQTDRALSDLADLLDEATETADELEQLLDELEDLLNDC
jgi:RHS repeat-associated protein